MQGSLGNVVFLFWVSGVWKEHQKENAMSGQHQSKMPITMACFYFILESFSSFLISKVIHVCCQKWETIQKWSKNESALPQCYSSKATMVHSLDCSLTVVSVHFGVEGYVLQTVMWFVLSLVHIFWTSFHVQTCDSNSCFWKSCRVFYQWGTLPMDIEVASNYSILCIMQKEQLFRHLEMSDFHKWKTCTIFWSCIFLITTWSGNSV